ncbi:A-kinase anchor protein 5 [Lemmus lemmus]
MESGASEIQIDTKDEKEPGAVCPQKERQERNRATLCFKRRKKTSKMKSKAVSKTAEGTKTRPPEAGTSDQPQPAGAWASIKRLVTPRKRSKPLKTQKPSVAEVQPEDAALPKKKAKSRLKIPCIRFSRGAKRSHHSKLKEDSDYNIGVQQRGADDLEVKPQTQPADRTSQAKSTQGPQEGVVVEDGKDVQEPQVSRYVTSRENVISVELELKDESSAIQMGTPMLEKEAEVIKEKPRVQAQQASPLESSEADSPCPVASHVPTSPATAYQSGGDKPSDNIQDYAASVKDDRSRKGAAEEKKADEATVAQAPDLKENGIDTEKPRSQECKRMEPIAIIITDTEISEFDVKKSKNVPKQFLISMENEQVGVFANDSDFEGRTSEQYEALLIETASSLVKNAIQLSVEQLVNEMVSEDNKINTLLQ